MRTGKAMFGLAMVVAFSISVSTQSKKWLDTYENGLKAFEAHKFEEAIVQLEKAVAADPKAGAHKYYDGVFPTDYFPYYYLGVAYLELRQYDKAEQNFNKAKYDIPQGLQARFSTFQRRLSSEVAIAKGSAAPGPSQNSVSSSFELAVRQAESALAAGRYIDALAAFDSADNLDPKEYARKNIGAQRNEAARRLADQLVDDGRQLFLNSHLGAAKIKFQQAEQAFPGLKGASDGREAIRQRQDDYRRYKSAGEQDVINKNFKSARSLFELARSADPEQFNADDLAVQLAMVLKPSATVDNAVTTVVDDLREHMIEAQRLLDKGKQLASQGKYIDAESNYRAAIVKNPKNGDAADALHKSQKFAGLWSESVLLAKGRDVATAQQRLVAARDLDPARFEREGLTSLLDWIVKQRGDDPDKAALRDALLALLQGDAPRSVAILEQALSQRKTQTGAPLHAYLGVAYATRALTSPKQEEEERLRAKAFEQFRLAVAAQADYQLSRRIVSPKIVRLFDEARR